MAGAANKGTYGEDFGVPFQGHFLAVAARTPGLIIRFRSALDPNYFVSEIHRVTAQALFAHVDQYASLPTKTTLIEAVRLLAEDDTMPALEQFVDTLYTEDISDATAVAEKVVAFGKQQAMINAVVSSAEKLDKGERDILPLIQQAMLVGEDILDIGIDYRQAAKLREGWYSVSEEAVDVIPTGLTHLDLALDGGLGRGELGVILGFLKRGKSITLANIAFGAMMAGHNVVYYSCEMRRHLVARRLDSRLAGPHARLRTTDPEKYRSILAERQAQFLRGGVFIQHYPTRKLTVSMVRSHLSILAAQDYVPSCIIIDYADIMKPQRRLGEMRHEQAGIYEDLRELAGDYDAALWTASQTNRNAADKETTTVKEIGEALEKAAIADAVIALSQTPDELREMKFRFSLAALRNVQDGGTIEGVMDRAHCRITTLALYDAANNRRDPVDDDAATANGEGNKRDTVNGLRNRLGMHGGSGANGKKVPARKLPSKKVPVRKTL
jgi:replicative DNA helicase